MPVSRNLVVQRSICSECDAVLDEAAAKKHFHAIQRLGPGSYLLVLPEGVRAGTWEAALALSAVCKELEEKNPGTSFQYLPFGFATSSGSPYESGLYAIMALVIRKNGADDA